MEKEPGFYIKLVRNRIKIKRAEAVKRKWESATAMAKERVASLTSECATMRPTLQEREDHLRAKEKKCKVLQLNLAQETERGVSSEQDCVSLRASHANVQKTTVDLCKRLGYAAKVQRME